MKKIIIWSILLLLSIHILNAQNYCGTPSNAPNSLSTIPQSQFKTASQSYVVNVFFHIMRNSDGSGGQTQSDVKAALSILKRDFAPHGICISLLGIDEINHNGLNTMLFGNDLNGDGKFDDYKVNTHSNAIDIYFFGSDMGTMGGRGAAIPSSALYIGGSGFNCSNFATSSVISHELGHCLGLYHTNHGKCLETDQNSCIELVNGSNSTTCGDYVSDTPADPGIDFERGVDQTTCIWYGATQCDGDLHINYPGYIGPMPNPNLIMSNTWPSCMSYHTPGQGARMRNMIANTPFLQNTLVTYNSIPFDLSLSNYTVQSGQNITNLAQNNITTSASVLVANSGKLTLKAGNKIVLSPNFTSKTGSTFSAYIDNCIYVGSSSHKTSREIEHIENLTDNPSAKYANLNSGVINAELKVYPNPNNGNFKLALNSNIELPQSITIYDCLGKEIKTITNPNAYELDFNLADYDNGLYIINVYYSNSVQSKRIVKQ